MLVKKIVVPCKLTQDDQHTIVAKKYLTELFEREDLVLNGLVSQLVTNTSLASSVVGECRYVYCPIYHACPYSDEVCVGVRGRKHKAKVVTTIIKPEVNLEQQKDIITCKDSVTDYVVKSDGSVE